MILLSSSAEAGTIVRMIGRYVVKLRLAQGFRRLRRTGCRTLVFWTRRRARYGDRIQFDGRRKSQDACGAGDTFTPITVGEIVRVSVAVPAGIEASVLRGQPKPAK